MKAKIILIFVLLLTAQAGMKCAAQVDRSVPPKAGPAPEIKFEQPSTFTLNNGLQVIVSENHELPLVSFQITVDADPVREKDAVGYVAATGNLLRNGTQNRTKAEIDEAVDLIGATLNTHKNGIYASSLKKHSRDLLEIMSDVLMNPVFPEEEVDKYKKNQVSSLRSGETNASYIAGRVAQKLRYGDHPYGELKTEETIQNINRQKCMDYYNAYYRPNTSYLVIVGDIRPWRAWLWAKRYFGDWEKAEVPRHDYDLPDREKGPQVALVHKEDAVQSVVSVTYPIQLAPGDPDAIDAKVMNNILGGGVFSGYLMQNLREDKGYTYGARSQLKKDPLVGYFEAGAEVGTEVTDSAIYEILYEMGRIRYRPVDSAHLKMVQQVITGQFARSLEDARTKAGYALNTKRYNLPEDYYANYLKHVEQVNVEDVRYAARKYIKPEESIILVVGDQTKVWNDIIKFDANKEVVPYNEVGEPKKETIVQAKNMDARMVIWNYIQVLGGVNKLAQIDNVVQTATLYGGRMPRTMKTYRQKPNKQATQVIVGGEVIQEEIFDGEKGRINNVGVERMLSGKSLEKLKSEAIMHKFLKYDELGYSLELLGSETVRDSLAYKIKITDPNDRVRYNYYDVGSWLKVKSERVSEQGEITRIHQFSHYKKVNGVKFPHKVSVTVPGGSPVYVKVDDVKVNENIDEEVFSIDDAIKE